MVVKLTKNRKNGPFCIYSKYSTKGVAYISRRGGGRVQQHLEKKNLKQAPPLVAAGMPLFLGLILKNAKKERAINCSWILSNLTQKLQFLAWSCPWKFSIWERQEQVGIFLSIIYPGVYYRQHLSRYVFQKALALDTLFKCIL